MASMNLEDCDLTDLRNKRGFRKGWITKAEKLRDGYKTVGLESTSQQVLKRNHDQTIVNRDEYLFIQRHLIERLDTADPRSEELWKKEVDDLETEEPRFEALIDDFCDLLKQKEIMTAMCGNIRTLYRNLKELADEPSFVHIEVQDRLFAASRELRSIGAQESLLPETFCTRTGPRILELSKMMQPLLAKERADRPAPVTTPIRMGGGAVSPIISGPTTPHPRSRLPDHKFPKFFGDKLRWPAFWKSFTAILEQDTRLTELDKLNYLRDSVKTTEAEREFSGLPGDDDDYQTMARKLERIYHDPRLMFRTQVQDVVNAKVADRSGSAEWHRVLSNALMTLRRSAQYDADHIMVILGEMKLGGKLREDWIRAQGKNRDIPKMEDLLEFLEDTGRNEQQIAEGKTKTQPNVSAPPFKPKKPTVLFTQPVESPPTAPPPPTKSIPKHKKPCKLCNINRHAMSICELYQAMDLAHKKEVVQKYQLCSNCLGYGHTPLQCRSTFKCRECHQSHHTSLHEPTTNTTPAPDRLTLMATSTNSEGTMPTAIVMLEVQGRMVKARAVLDSCSTKSYITSSMVQQLRAPADHGPSIALGVGMIDGLHSTTRTSVVLHPRNSKQRPPFLLEAGITKDISVDLPFSFLKAAKDLPFLQELNLADPSFSSPGRIDLLLGLQGTGVMATKGVVENFISDDGVYQATSTIYGWVVQGWQQKDEAPTTATVLMTQEKPPAHDLREFWQVEGHSEADKTLSRDDSEALKYFAETVTHDKETGRYVVRLPRKTPTPELGHSRQQAERRFYQNQKSLVKKNQWTTFCTVVSEYEQLKHAELVPAADLSKQDKDCYYLPMHGVTKEASTSTKLRVVFDASARSSNGISLNDTLLPGPNQYPLITDVLLKFRKHLIGMTADISKMFREVGLHPADRDLHRFLWMNRDNTLDIWRMTRVTFGVTSSPFLATQTLLQLATDHETEHPTAARIVREEFYVDDCVTGADTIEQATALRYDLNELLHKAGMTLRKWRTNSIELQSSIPSNLCEEETRTTLLSPQDCHKTLGIHWNPSRDQMFISTPDLGNDRTPTKRQVSSDLARTFDVMGWFSPSMVLAKLIIQELWILGLGWDDYVPHDISKRWSQWTEELPLLASHPINRCYFHKSKEKISSQLHGFCDASEKAYGGAVYLRTFYKDTTTTISLLISKTRVAPIKPLTIPKLELCGAVLLSQLLKHTQEKLEISPELTYAWTDSTVVLGWLNHNPGRLKVFVANRVVSITKIIGPDRWRYVPTNSNPADAASRGLMPQELISHHLWWNGPEWLSGDPGDWPKHPQQKIVTLPEVKLDLTLFTASPPEVLALTENFSSLNLLRRTTAWIRRFINNAQNKYAHNRQLGPRLTTVELVAAEHTLIKMAQRKHYSAELEALSCMKEVSSKSSVRGLCPIIDREGVLRVGGRLENSSLPFPAKHPIILPRQSHLVKLIIRHLHVSNHHIGSSTLIALLAEQYHVTGVRTAVRSVTRQCIICKRTTAKRSQQLMGQLPSYRATMSPVFSQVGTDFAGPLIVKSGNPRKPRKTKSFICLFICMATKAVHIELVSDLTTSAFLAALHRFTSRRGLPHTVHSDNGTNYMGADNELSEAYNLLTIKDNADDIQRDLTNLKIHWSHTPARAPHFGGLWESTVKSVKSLLKKTICQTILTFEELTTVLCQIESSLNSRPLVPLHAQPSEGTLALTPGHFLIGRAMKSVPDLQSIQPGSSYRRWNLCQQLARDFWEQWTKSYLVTLNKRNRWTHPERNIQVGDIVLIKDMELFTNVWPLAIVTEVHPGTDGLVRAATVRNGKGIYRRPIVKLTLLLTEDDRTDQTDQTDPDDQTSPSSPGRMDAPTSSPLT